MVRAKFRCESKTEFVNGVTVEFLAVTASGSEENKTFWKYTPSGTLKMHTINADAAAQFEVGKEYYLDFSPAYLPVGVGG